MALNPVLSYGLCFKRSLAPTLPLGMNIVLGRFTVA